DLRGRAFADAHDVIERDHGAGVGANVQIADVARLAAERLCCLDVNAIGAVVEVKIVDVGRAQVNLQRVGNLLHGHLQAERLAAVDVDHELRIVGRERTEEPRQGGIGVAIAGDLLGNIIEVLYGVAAFVLDLEGETAEAADTRDGRG